MSKMSKLRHNLVDGGSYLLQDGSPDPANTGEVLASNIEWLSAHLYGDAATDEQIEFIIDLVSAGVVDAYDPEMDINEAIRRTDRYAKARGGEGFL